MYQIISVIVMCIVTYIPRAIPITFIKREVHSRFIKSFLFYIPYAVLGTLTFPFVFYSTNSVIASILGTISAIILSFFKQKLIVVITISVIVVYGFSFIF